MEEKTAPEIGAAMNITETTFLKQAVTVGE